MIAVTAVPRSPTMRSRPEATLSAPILVVVCTGVTVYNCASPASVRAYESQFYSPETSIIGIGRSSS
jgi:hypothetical protein